MHANDLVAAFSEAVQCDDPMSGARSVMEDLKGRTGEVLEALSYLSGTGGNARQAFYRSPNLSLLKVSFPNGRRTPPHSHGTWATILVLEGVEKNTLYRHNDDGSLKRVSDVDIGPGDILPMRAEAVHVAECMGDAPALGLHVYGADVLGVDRFMWDPETLERHELDWAMYEPLAQKASKMAGAPAA